MTIAARPTVYNGTQMRSRLEARAAFFLDTVGVSWKYEPRAYKAASGEYLPDFQIAPHTFIEVKAAGADWEGSVLRALRVLTEAEPRFTLWVLLSDGYASMWTADARLPSLGGLLSVCTTCHRWTLRPQLQAELCFCGATPTDARAYLEWYG